MARQLYGSMLVRTKQQRHVLVQQLQQLLQQHSTMLGFNSLTLRDGDGAYSFRLVRQAGSGLGPQGVPAASTAAITS